MAGDDYRDSGGVGPTGYGEEPGRPAPGVSHGEGATGWIEGELEEAGSELPPELVEEQKRYLLQTGDVVAERFEVMKQLGFGGMGAVYQVKDRQLGGAKALKVMLPSLIKNKEARERFRSEVAISQQLRHDNIVTVYDLMADKARGFYFFTMEYVEGKTLHRHLKDRGGRLPVDEALDIARQLCDALAYAHQETIHRDLKPQNIMVEPDGRIKVLDFGLAKLMSPGRLTKSSMALGTAYYQAPEQSVRLGEVDQRADIYALGVILYELITGELPVGHVKPPSRRVAGIAKPVDNVILTCIESRAEDRYSTAEEVWSALSAARGKRRSPATLFTAALVLVLLGLGGWYGYTQVVAPELDSGGEMATAAEASHARVKALAAQSAAQEANAPEHASDLYTQAEETLKDAAAHDRLQHFDQAVAGYEDAVEAFRNAEQEATRIAEEIAKLDEAKSAAESAKASADELNATEWAQTRYEQATTALESAAGMDNRVQAAEKYTEAADLFALARKETAQQGEAIVSNARGEAESARDQADAALVERYASDAWAEAENAFEQAANTDGDFTKAQGLYEDAASKFQSASRLAAERRDEAKAEAETAREAALTAQSRIGADEREYAAEELARGKEAMDVAEAAGADYSKAAVHYRLATEKYTAAVSVAPERKRAAMTPEAGDTKTVDLGGGVELEMVWIPAGSFMMGSPENEEGRDDDEGPRHRVEITQGFWMGKYEVTNEQYRRFLEATGDDSGVDWDDEDCPLRRSGNGYGLSDNDYGQDWRQPMVEVLWEGAVAFCQWASGREDMACRLPTEAEWEYACRAGTTTRFYYGDDPGYDDLGAYAWYDDNAGGRTHAVGQKRANDWGLYDMHGNVWEWCQDWYGEDYYAQSPERDPTGPRTGQYRVVRGGSWGSNPGDCRSAIRDWYFPDFTSYVNGFRVVFRPASSH